MGYGDPRGSAELRGVLAAYLRRVRGSAADPDRMVICSGFAQGIGLVLRALVQQGARRLALEDPGDRDNDVIAERAGLTPVPTTVDALGLHVDALAANQAQAVLLTPAHQTPTGVVLAPARRQELVGWAARTGGVIIEDDYDAEFRYDRQPVGSLQGLAPDHVVTMGSVSKSLAPALRLGWIVCPPHLIEAVATEKEVADRGSPVLEQLALARLIQSGRYDRHLRRMRAVYAARRQALVQALTGYAPRVRLGGLAAGFHAVARLPEPATERQVVSAARDRGVGVYGMSRYRAGGACEPAELVIGFGNVTENAVARGIESIADLLNGVPVAPNARAPTVMR
jgi:GntR family transcriptional regulator/MocR family aminotransferase